MSLHEDSTCRNSRDWVPNGGFRPRRYHPGGIGNWSGHLPFAFDLISALRPGLLVELGTHFGESYFGFCQAVAENNIPCCCYAVDTWSGEYHAGFYDESVYSDVSAYNSTNYRRFSYLLRTTFDAALSNFSEESIDILHIDGLHTYEAVFHDFHSWLPKVKPGGIVLLHDVIARHNSFGVWKLWEELPLLGQCFAFTHSWGLGVFRKPGSMVPDNGLFDLLFDSHSAQQEHCRKFYALCAMKLEMQHYDGSARVPLQIFPYSSIGYSEETTINVDLLSGDWQDLAIDLASGSGDGPLRIDPLNRPGIIDLAGIQLRTIDNGVLWTANGSDTCAIAIGGTLTREERTAHPDFCRFISDGADPQFFLPYSDPEISKRPLRLELRLRVQTDLVSVLALLKEADQLLFQLNSRLDATSAERDALSADRSRLSSELNEMATGRSSITVERDALTAERDRLLSACSAFEAERSQLQKEHDVLCAERHELMVENDRFKAELDRLRSTCSAFKAECTQLQKAHDGLCAERHELMVENDRLKTERDAIRSQRHELSVENDRLKAERDNWLQERESLQETLRNLHSDLYLSRIDVKRVQRVEEERRSTLEQTISEKNILQSQLAQLKDIQSRLAESDRILHQVLTSRSWRVTSPLRWFSAAFR